jgi:hypothetical protein
VSNPVAINLPALRKLAEKNPWSVADAMAAQGALPAIVKEIELMRDIVLTAVDVLDESEEDGATEETLSRLTERVDAWLEWGEQG